MVCLQNLDGLVYGWHGSGVRASIAGVFLGKSGGWGGGGGGGFPFPSCFPLFLLTTSTPHTHGRTCSAHTTHHGNAYNAHTTCEYRGTGEQENHGTNNQTHATMYLHIIHTKQTNIQYHRQSVQQKSTQQQQHRQTNARHKDRRTKSWDNQTQDTQNTHTKSWDTQTDLRTQKKQSHGHTAKQITHGCTSKLTDAQNKTLDS